MTALPQPRRRWLRRAAVAVVAGLGLAATTSCAPAAGPTPGSSQVPSSSTPSSRAATSATGSSDDRLIAAAWAGDVPTAKALIEAGADVNRLKYPALHEAVILGRSAPSYADTLRLLVSRGADVTLPAGEPGLAPLDAARDRGYAPVIATVEAALAAKAAPAPTASAALLAAATSGDADAAAIALRQGADLETRDGNGRTPLILAATHDRVDVARLLVALGADPDSQDVQQDSARLVTGVTALQHARGGGQTKVANCPSADRPSSATARRDIMDEADP